MNVRFCLTPALVMSITGMAWAGDDAAQAPYTIGDAAKPINIEHWVKGEKFEKFEPGKVYVVEFWATWCGPCLMSMPHISDLQDKYKDYGVKFVGVSDEPLETVTKFLASNDKKDNNKPWNDKIRYTLTTDPDESVYTDYMKAAGQNGIPTAFIIGKDAMVEWIGHPMEIDAPLEAVVKDEWDRSAAKAKFEKEQASERAMQKHQQALMQAYNAKDWDKVLSVVDEMIADAPDASYPKFIKFATLLAEMNQPEKAYAYGEELLKASWEDVGMLNQVAWFVAENPDIQTRNFDFAHKAASRAAELKPKDAAILDTLARCQFEKGDVKTAIETQKKAVELAQDPEMKAQLEEALKKYEAKAAG